MQKSEVVCRLFVPEDHQPPKPIHPRMRALHRPAPRPLSGCRLQFPYFFPTTSNVRRKAKLRDRGPYFGVVVARSQTQSLWCCPWPLNHDVVPAWLFAMYTKLPPNPTPGGNRATTPDCFNKDFIIIRTFACSA